MVEAIPAGCEICISYIRTFCRFVKIFFIQINSFPFFVQFEIFTTKFSKLTSICYICANGKCARVLSFAQDQTWPDHFCSRSFRQQLLQEKFGFSCSCIKCRWDSPRSCVHQTLFYPAAVSSTYTYPSILGYFYRTRVPSLGMLVSNSLTDWLTNCCLVNLIDVALACEDANSKLVEVVTIAHVDAQDHVGNSLLQVW